MPARNVVIVETGLANTASVRAGISRCGATATLSLDPRVIASASHVVLPGVGTFGAGMAKLIKTGLDDVLRDRLANDQPTLAVCLGLQLLCESSEESPDVLGLGVIKRDVRRFDSDVRTPQFGWNQVAWASGDLTDGYAYFANSFKLDTAPAGWDAAIANHGGPFIAALRRGSTLACQFHPELSGPWGTNLIASWLGIGESSC